MQNKPEQESGDEVYESIEEAKDQAIIDQVENEYQLCWQSQQPKIKESLARLKLFNNQARDKTKVGDPLLYTVFQTVFSSLYDDKLSVTFEANEESDEVTAENITALAEHDYRVMEKAKIDYEWGWDSCFFGRGLLLFNQFDRDKMCPLPEVIDPMTFLRDPNATSVNGDSAGRGAMRFGGREIGLTMWQMEDLEGGDNGFFNLDKVKKNKNYNNLTEEARQMRRQAQNNQHVSNQENALEDNFEYTLLEWFTHIDGKKCIVTLTNDRSIIVRKQELKGERWNIIDRPFSPISHDWDGVSIPDLIEDKQRARAKMLNLGLDAAIADLHPMYFYNKKKIRNKKSLDFAFNKAVGVDGDVTGAYAPMQKANSVTQQVQNIFAMLDVASQKAVAAPEIAQGITPAQSRTLGENELVATARGSRMSLAAAVWGWSEADFWLTWYSIYKVHLKEDIDEKIVRIKNPLTTKWKKFTKENIIAHVDPDVYVESRQTSEARRQRNFQELMQFAQVAMQDPATNRRYLYKRLAKISRMDKEEIRMIFPPTPDEILAENENEMLAENKMVRGNATDDHIAHIELHREVEQTPALLAHIEFHKAMILAQKQNPELFPQQQQQNQLQDVSKVQTPDGQQPTRADMLSPNPQSVV